MATKESEDIIERWLFRSTGQAILAALQVLALALLVVAEKSIPKSAMLTVIGAQLLILVAVLFLTKKRLAAKDNEIVALRNKLPEVREKIIQVESAKKEEAPAPDLTDEDVQTLAGLAEKPDGTYVIHLAHEIGLSKTRTNHSIDRLTSFCFVEQIGTSDCGPTFEVTGQGRKHLIENDLA